MDEMEYDYDAGVCEECRNNGDDYYIDAKGDMVCACDDCIMKPEEDD
jgi:hypothetical protein